MNPKEDLILNEIYASLVCEFTYYYGKDSSESVTVYEKDFTEKTTTIRAFQNYNFKDKMNIPSYAYSHLAFHSLHILFFFDNLDASFGVCQVADKIVNHGPGNLFIGRIWKDYLVVYVGRCRV